MSGKSALITIKTKKVGSMSPNPTAQIMMRNSAGANIDAAAVSANLRAIVKARSNPRMGSGSLVDMAPATASGSFGNMTRLMFSMNG